MKLHELSDAQLIDAVRVGIGLDPLYAPMRTGKESCGSYLHLERLRQAADPSCTRCGGSGYYDGERIQMRCSCTGIVQRMPSSGLKPGTGNTRFAYRRRNKS